MQVMRSLDCVVATFFFSFFLFIYLFPNKHIKPSVTAILLQKSCKMVNSLTFTALALINLTLNYKDKVCTGTTFNHQAEYSGKVEAILVDDLTLQRFLKS